MGLNLLTGYNGQVSIGHGAFFGLGMYTTAILMQSARLAVPADAARRGRRSRFVVGVLVGLPGAAGEGPVPRARHARPRGALPELTNRFVHVTGADCGTSQVGELARGQAAAAGVGTAERSSIGRDDQWAYYATLASPVVGIVVLVSCIVRSRFGRALIAVRDHEAAAETVGINVARVKVHRVRAQRALRGRGGLVLRCSSKRLGERRRRCRPSSSRSSSSSRS